MIAHHHHHHHHHHSLLQIDRTQSNIASYTSCCWDCHTQV